MSATSSLPVEFYTPKQVADMFQTSSDWWVREGVRRGRWECARGPKRAMRFSREHVQQIADVLQGEAQSVASSPVDVSVFGVTSRSSARNRRKAS